LEKEKIWFCHGCQERVERKKDREKQDEGGEREKEKLNLAIYRKTEPLRHVLLCVRGGREKERID
jgi:hypothetical protein